MGRKVRRWYERIVCNRSGPPLRRRPLLLVRVHVQTRTVAVVFRRYSPMFIVDMPKIFSQRRRTLALHAYENVHEVKVA